MERILAAIDGSEASTRALTHAAKLARRLDASLDILLVRLILIGRSTVHVVLTDDEVETIKTAALACVKDAGVPSANFILTQSRDTAFKIVDTAIERDADLIVMGASGRSGVKAFLLGSISQEVLKKSACPVMIVH